MIDVAAFGEDAVFHHVGLAVRSVREVSPESDPVVDETQQVAVALVRLNGITVELVEPWGDESPVRRSLGQGVKLLHLCFEVPDLERAMALGQRAGFHRIAHPVPAVPFGGRRIAWVFSNQYGLVELVEAA